MKVSVLKLKALEDSGMLAGYKRIIDGANASGVPKRIAAAVKVQESLTRLEAFIAVCHTFKVRRGNYIIPGDRKEDARKVRMFIGRETIFSKIMSKNGKRHAR